MFNHIALENIFRENMDLAKKKNHDYGSKMDAIAICGIEGIAVRLADKAARVLSLSQPGFQAKVNDEALEDTLRDMVNYALYGVSLLEGTWGKDNPPVPDLDPTPVPEAQKLLKVKPKIVPKQKTKKVKDAALEDIPSLSVRWSDKGARVPSLTQPGFQAKKVKK